MPLTSSSRTLAATRSRLNKRPWLPSLFAAEAAANGRATMALFKRLFSLVVLLAAAVPAAADAKNWKKDKEHAATPPGVPVQVVPAPVVRVRPVVRFYPMSVWSFFAPPPPV